MNQQRTLEKQFNIKRLIFLLPSESLAEVFGPIEDWIMQVGDFQLLLEPSSGTWMFFDKIHDTWDTMGFRAGEVIFFLENEELALRPNSEPTIWIQDRRFDLVENLHLIFTLRLAGGFIDKEDYSEKIRWLEIKDRYRNIWKLRETDRLWVTWNGLDWVEGRPPREYLPLDGVGVWQKFVEVKRQFFELWGKVEDGILTHQEYIFAVNQLRLQDDRGSWWQVRAADGIWLRWDGKNWLEQQPHVGKI